MALEWHLEQLKQDEIPSPSKSGPHRQVELMQEASGWQDGWQTSK